MLPFACSIRCKANRHLLDLYPKKQAQGKLICSLYKSTQDAFLIIVVPKYLFVDPLSSQAVPSARSGAESLLIDASQHCLLVDEIEVAQQNKITSALLERTVMGKTIGEVAKALNINVETVRFYERRGLITQPPKPGVGYRQYPEETINRIRFIKRAQELGFTLDEIASLLSLEDSPCSRVQALAERKLGTVKEKLADLQRLEQALNAMLEQCQDNNDASRCPIIDSFQP